MSTRDGIRRRLRRSPAYTLARDAQLRWRMVKDPKRAAPSFIVIGAHKAGTTSFYSNLTTHPRIWPAWRKEVHYFDRTPLPSRRWYDAHFPPARELAATGGITGEASPSYSLLPHLPDLVHDRLPECKLIMLLRDPVDRVYSAYQYNVRGGMLDMSFDDWIERDFRLLAGKFVDGEVFRELFSSPEHVETTPVGLLRGIYVEQIRFWREVFGKEQLLVLNSSDYFADPPALLNRVATGYLGLQEHPFTYVKTRTEARDYPKLSEDMAARLSAFYRRYNESLYTYLGTDFGWK